MNDRKTISRLKRVLSYYERRLDLLKTELLAQNQNVKHRQTALEEAQQKLSDAQAKLTGENATLANRLMGARFDVHTQREIFAKRDALNQATAELQKQKSAVRKQMQKVESMGKLIERKSKELQAELGKKEQLLADERHLTSTWKAKQ